MNRLELLNLIAEMIRAQDYLEIGVAEGNTLANVAVPRRTGVDPAPRYFAMDQERLAALRLLEVHESESDHFFQHNTRTFDLIFVDGLHLYEQAMKDILNGLDVLNPGGFIVVHDLIPLEPEHANRDRSTDIWNGDVWKVVFDLWKHHKDAGYFVIDADSGLGVVWKKQEASRFSPSWQEYIRDFGYEVMDKAGREFLNKLEPSAELVRGRIAQVLADKAEDIRAHQSLRFGRRLLRSAEDFAQALDAPAAGPHTPDCCWIIEEERYERPDEARLKSNFPAELFRKTVCAGTGGNILRPEKKVYLLDDALLTPCTPSKGKWPYLWNITDRRGASMTDLLQRRDGPAPEIAPGQPVTELSGLHVYLGWFAPYFGHFLSEVLPQLWIARHLGERTPRFLFHVEPGGRAAWESRDDDLARFVRKVLEQFGVRFEQITFIEGPVRVERLVAPTPMNRYLRGARPELFDMAREVRDALDAQAGPGSERIYLSRSRFEGRRFVNGEQIEALFARRGFRIVHPETLPLAEQISLSSKAKIIAGEEGSALCNAFFADRPAVIDLESGRFHPNLAKLSYAHASQYVYLPPYPRLEDIPPVRQDSLLYAHPWVVDECLASMFDAAPAGEALCGPRSVADRLQKALGFSLAGEPERVMEQLLEVAQEHPKHFKPEYLSHCQTNLTQCGTPQAGLEIFALLSVKLLRAWKGRQRPLAPAQQAPASAVNA